MNEVQRVNNTYGKPVTLKEWGILSGMLNDILYMLKGVKNLHVVVTAHEEIVRDDERGMTYIMPVAMGKISATLPAFFHEVYRCRTRRTSHGVEYYIVTKALDNAPGNTILRGLGAEEVPNYKSIIAKDKAVMRYDVLKPGKSASKVIAIFKFRDGLVYEMNEVVHSADPKAEIDYTSR